MSQTAVLTTEWSATLNDRSWGNDILHATQVDAFVVETTMRFFDPVPDRRAEADELFDAFVAQFFSVYEA